jgi:hypothetical protein
MLWTSVHNLHMPVHLQIWRPKLAHEQKVESSVLRPSPMDRKKTGTGPGPDQLQPDRWLQLHVFWTKAGCSCLVSGNLLQLIKDQLQLTGCNRSFSAKRPMNRNTFSYYVVL